MQHDKVLILDFGSQYTQLIARRVRELNIYCEIHPYNKIPTHLDEFKAVLSPVLMSIPAQLLAYHVAKERGTDVDQPRNLAKSVTVE